MVAPDDFPNNDSPEQSENRNPEKLPARKLKMEATSRSAQSDVTAGGADNVSIPPESHAGSEKIPTPGAVDFSGTMPSKSNANTVSPAAVDPKIEPELPATFGRYQVQGFLGRGAFGAVFLGFDKQLERKVAIKAPLLNSDSDEAARLFLAEARQLAQLNHPAIVSVFDVGIEKNGQCYIVSDYIKGVSLREWLKRRSLTWQETVQIVAMIADGLSHAHANRTIHRDLKPSNIIMTDEQTPVIVDFGLAISDLKELESQRGKMAGTPSYMAPEQARGEGHRIDGRADIYALGVILYQMLTGRLPFKSDSITELVRMIHEDEPQPPRQLSRDLPKDLERICLKAMAKRFKSRYSNADDMASALRRLLTTSEDPLSGRQQIQMAVEETIETPVNWSRQVGSRAASRRAISPADSPADPNASGSPPEELALPSAGSSLKPKSTRPPGGGSTMEDSTRRKLREAERRRVSVVQCGCNIFESEELLAALEEDEANDVLVEFQNLCRNIVINQRGFVVQTTDQGLLACFGFPASLEDATQRSVRAGLQVLEEMRYFNARLQSSKQIQLSARIGIHSDYAVLEEKLDGDSISLTGQVRTIASQVEQVTESNAIFITGATHRLIKGYFCCESAGKQRLRGTGEIELFRVLSESTTERIAAAEVSGLTPLIGRDREVGLLKERWDQAAEGMGQVVLLIGDAGLGKSRLVHVLKEHVPIHSEEELLSVVEWRTSLHHQNSSLYPAIECFERLLGFERETSSAERLEKVVRHLARLGLDDDENVALLASLLTIPVGDRYPLLTFSPQEEKERTFAFLLEWLTECSQLQPILFVVEDLHWIDPSSLQFLELFVDEGLNDSILTLLTFRPEFETPWKSKSHQTSIALNRLTRQQVSELVSHRIGSQRILPAVIDQLIERTAGVPLFVEEFATMIVESRTLREKESGGTSMEDSLSLTAIPGTLQDLLMARLDRMSGNVELIQLASALGREFSHEMISAVSDLDDATVSAELDLLVSSDLLTQRGRDSRRRYSFKHALIQDAAYQSLVKRKRVEVHQRIASTLENSFADMRDKQPEVLSFHFAEAGINKKSVHYLQAAGTRALAQYAHREAIEHLTKALELLQTLPESNDRDKLEIQLHVSLGVPLQSILGYSAPEVESNYARAHELCKKMGMTGETFPILYGLFRFFMLQANYQRAFELGSQLVELANQSRKPTDIVAANRALGSTLLYQGKHADALTHLKKVISIPATGNLRDEVYGYDVVDPWIASLSYMSWAMWLRGFPDRATFFSRQAFSTAEELGHPFSIVLCTCFSQWLHQFQRDVSGTRAAATRAEKLTEDQGSAFWVGWNQIMLGWTDALRGDAKIAVNSIREGIEAWRKQGSQLGSHYFYVLLAEACILANELDEGFAALDDAQSFAESTGEGYWLSEIQRVRGRLILISDPNNVDGAKERYASALEIARQQGAKSLELRAAASLAKLLSSQGQAAEAKNALAPVYESFTEGFDTRDLIRARRLLEKLDTPYS